MEYMHYATAALFVAVCDALRLAPCKKRSSCSKAGGSQARNLLRFIEVCWRIIPASVRKEVLWRLNVCRFADEHGYFTSITWPQFINQFTGDDLLSETFREQYSDWESDLRTRQSPARTIFRILQSRSPLTLEAATYLLEPLGREAKEYLSKALLNELVRVCRLVRFVSPTPHQYGLAIQFVSGGEIERRPLDPAMTF